MSPETKSFRNLLFKRFSKAYHRGKTTIDVRADDISREVSGDWETSRNETACSEVMRQEMRGDDHVLETPVSDSGKNLVVRYVLPRPPIRRMRG
jgi:hypothetical protein